MKEKLRPESLKPLVGKPLEEVIKIKTLHEERIMGGVNVMGVGIGMHETEETKQFAIKVYLNQEPTPKQMEDMEKEVDGVPMLYKTTGILEALLEKPYSPKVLPDSVAV